MSDFVNLKIKNNIATIYVDNPPVNALSQMVRTGLKSAISQAEEADISAIILICSGRTFFAGADIREFGKPPVSPGLSEVRRQIENCRVPVVAAIHGTALGGGLEMAMACHYRIAIESARLGLPEVKLGLLPGAGGTQLSPRLMGVEAALDFMLSGVPISAKEALDVGLIDRVIKAGLEDAARLYLTELIKSGASPRRTSTLKVKSSHLAADFFEQKRVLIAKKTRNLPAPQSIIDCVEASVKLDISDALDFEAQRFTELKDSPESAGLRHTFFAERQAAIIEGIPKNLPARSIETVGIIGAGTMGGGIAMCFANAGIPVTLLEINQESLNQGVTRCSDNYKRSVSRGRFTSDQVKQFMSRIRGTIKYDDLAEVDLVIEAVFEESNIKRQLFRKLDEICKPGAILASNTSYLDINGFAAETSRPGDVIGMHFFSPANIMKLLEVIRCEKTSDDVLITIMKLAKKIRKVPVVSRVGYGFIGNRLFQAYKREAQLLLLEGASPHQVDSALEQFGMAMGPLAVLDLAGLDIGYKARRATPDLPDHRSNLIADQLVEMDRLGQKSGAGFYRYDANTQQRLNDPTVDALIQAEADKLGIEQSTIADAEIIERTIYALINEGARVLEENIAQRPGDIDIAYIYGYGFPAHRGGPMFYGSSVGLDEVYGRICEFRDTLQGQDWEPAPLLKQLTHFRTKNGNKFQV